MDWIKDDLWAIADIQQTQILKSGCTRSIRLLSSTSLMWCVTSNPKEGYWASQFLQYLIVWHQETTLLIYSYWHRELSVYWVEALALEWWKLLKKKKKICKISKINFHLSDLELLVNILCQMALFSSPSFPVIVFFPVTQIFYCCGNYIWCT